MCSPDKRHIVTISLCLSENTISAWIHWKESRKQAPDTFAEVCVAYGQEHIYREYRIYNIHDILGYLFLCNT